MRFGDQYLPRREPGLLQRDCAEIQDRFFKNVEGVFGPAEITGEDAATYLEYIETILIPALEGGS